MTGNTRSWRAAACGLIVVALHLASACSARGAPATDVAIADDDTAATVNGEPIAVAELRHAVDRARAVATGRREGDALKKAALDEAVRTKLVQRLMHDQGWLTDVTYPGFRVRWQRENARRREAMQRGEPIYGPEQYSEQEYFDYLLGNGVIALKEHLPGLAATDSELRHDYDALRESMFRRGTQTTFEVIRSVYPPAATPAQKASVRAAMEAIAAQIRAGESPGSASRRATGVTSATVTLGGPRPRGVDQSLEPEVARVASELRPGASSDVLDTVGGLVMVHCVKVEDLGYLPFEQARGQLVYRHIDAAFEARVRSMIASADVQLRPEVYDRVTVR